MIMSVGGGAPEVKPIDRMASRLPGYPRIDRLSLRCNVETRLDKDKRLKNKRKEARYGRFWSWFRR